MRKAISVVIDWWGPYNGIDDARRRMPQWGSGVKALYMGLGFGNVCQYVGRTSNLKQRLNGRHHKLADEARIYVGQVSSQGKSGPKSNKVQVPADLHMAERVLIFVLKPENNEKSKEKPPKKCGVVFSRLFHAVNHETPVYAIPSKFPVLAAYDPLSRAALLLKGKRLTKWYEGGDDD